MKLLLEFGKEERKLADGIVENFCHAFNKNEIKSGSGEIFFFNLKREIIEKFPGVNRLEFIGTRHQEPGDIKVFKDNGVLGFAEIKTSLKTKSGTLANKGCASISNIFNNLEPYHTFVKNTMYSGKNYWQKVRELLKVNPLKNKPDEELYTKAREERDKKNSNALLTINALDKENKRKYINLMKEKYEKGEYNKEALFSLVSDLLKGINTKAQEKFRSNIIKTFLVNTNNGFVMLQSDKVKISKENLGMSFLPEITSFFVTNNGEKILRFTLHWKNIAQGIKTPCFNIFYKEGQ